MYGMRNAANYIVNSQAWLLDLWQSRHKVYQCPITMGTADTNVALHVNSNKKLT